MGRYEYSDIERKILEGSRIPFAVYQYVDERVVSLILSDGFCDLFGYTDRAKAHHDMDNDMYAETHPDDASGLAEAAIEFAAGGDRYDFIYRTRIQGSAEYRIIHAVGEHFYTSGGERLAIVWYTDEGVYDEEDISAGAGGLLSEAMREKSRLSSSNYDYLTGLPNMTFFFDLAESAAEAIIESGGGPAMLFIDLRGMKHYNAKHGYKKGDELLVSFARLLTKHFGSERCCRMGEDHFVAVSEEAGLEERLNTVFREWEDMHKRDALAIRAGVYFRSMEPVDVSAACDRAKYACDSIRSNYTSCISYFDEAMLRESHGSRYIIENIDRAIEEKWIVPYYQAVVRSTNGKVCDEETLARWIDPEKGMLSPSFFVPVLEDAGLIYKLDLYMVEQALEKSRIMKELGYETNPISVNLSRRDFDTCDIIEEITKRVDAAGMDHSDINIEITESTVARDFDYIKAQVERFRELGFSVWMDDFGSGYSSLDLLQSIRFDLIKFDMHFMQQFDKGDETRIILTELIKMANALGVDTICEGVEKEEQVQFLREIGCSKIQGFYYERPLPLEDLLKKFEKGEQIGFEYPEEKEYYSKLGRVNMYDLSTIAGTDNSLKHYFNSLPMAIIEIRGEEARFARTNQSYREFIEGAFGYTIPRNVTEFSAEPQGIGQAFLDKVKGCSKTHVSIVTDERIPDGSRVHTLLRTIATNKVDGTTAVAVAVIAVTDNPEELSYANIARALASDYFNLFYVDLKTDEFIEYSSDAGRENIALERHDTDFFAKVSRDALSFLHEDDRERFIDAFDKEKILKTLDGQKSFSLDYRLLKDGKPIYVNMKITRMRDDDRHIIIGVSNVNLQMNQRKAIEKLMQEQHMYNRIRALTDDFEVMYIVEPETGNYIESSASSEFRKLGVSKTGDDFYRDSEINGRRLVHPDDSERFVRALRKENLTGKIRKDGELVMEYRLMMGEVPQLKRLKARMFEEFGSEKIIIGVTAI